MRGQSFNLLDIEHGMGFQEPNGFCRLLFGPSIGASAGDLAGIHNRAAALAFAHTGIQF
jgi:hypothetical protein